MKAVKIAVWLIQNIVQVKVMNRRKVSWKWG